MFGWSRVLDAAIVAIALSVSSAAAKADSFEQRWLFFPPPHAEPIPRDTIGQKSQAPAPGPEQDDAGMQAGPARSHGAKRAVPKTVIVGRASYYAYRGGRTASGRPFDAHALTAAHRTLPFGTRILVTNLKTHKSVAVLITDRGPASKSRILDLSLAAARALGITGVAMVRAEVIGG
jgi:peptidoglycan lytic transglycosylase